MANKISDFIEKPTPEKVRHMQVKMPEPMFDEVNALLTARGLTQQDVLMAGLKLFIAECKSETKKAK